jgi:membrane protein implicated in regulation of membrane protease activity
MGIITIRDTVTTATRPMSTGGFSLVIALGLALTLVAAGATVFAAVASASSATAIPLTAFGVTISASPLDMFVAGALAVVLLGLGFALISRGTRRSARTHKELRTLRKDKAIAATKAAADREDASASANDSAEDSTSSSSRKGANITTSKSTAKAAGNDTTDVTDTSAEAPRRRHSEAEQHSSV